MAGVAVSFVRASDVLRVSRTSLVRVSPIGKTDERADIQAVPHVGGAARADFLSGLITVDDELIALIDLDSLLLAEPA